MQAFSLRCAARLRPAGAPPPPAAAMPAVLQQPWRLVRQTSRAAAGAEPPWLASQALALVVVALRLAAGWGVPALLQRVKPAADGSGGGWRGGPRAAG